MKKRSNPIPLLIVVGLVFSLIGYMNFRSTPDSQTDAKSSAQPPQDPAAVGNSRPAPSVKDLQGAVNVGSSEPKTPTTAPVMPKMDPPGAGGPHGPGGPHGMQVPPDMAQIKANMKPPKPKPNDSSISTQWYTDETNKTVGH